MDIVLIVFLLAVLFHLKPVFRHELNREWLSVDNTNRLRGIMAVTIVLHHVSEHTTSGRFFPLLQRMGYLLVAVFFLLSGYGLMTQLRKKGAMYFRGFWKGKILFYIIVLALDTCAYWIVDLIEGNALTIRQAIVAFAQGITIAGNSWYLVVQIIFYIFFWISYRLVDEKKSFYILCALVLLFVTTLVVLKFPAYWIYSDLAFLLGVALAKWKDKVESTLDKIFYLAMATITMIFALFSAIPLYNKDVYVICRIVSAPAFSVALILSLCKINIKQGLWDKAGIISLELYLLHALVYRFLRGSIVYINSDVVYTCLVVVISIMISIPAHQINNCIKRKLLR